MFLSKAELEHLTTNRQFNDGYIRVIKSRLQKKIEVFVNQELPILVEKGYLDITEFRNVAENCYALIAQSGRGYRLLSVKMVKKEALGGIWTPDLYLFGGLSAV